MTDRTGTADEPTRASRAQRECTWVATGIVALLGMACPIGFHLLVADLLSPQHPPPMGLEFVFVLYVALPVVAAVALMNLYAALGRTLLPRWARRTCLAIGLADVLLVCGGPIALW